MRIKIIGDNDCARVTRQLVRLAGFAVTEFLPGDAVAGRTVTGHSVSGGPLAGYAITIDLAPATHTPDTHLRPDHSTHHSHPAAKEEAPRSHRGASSPSFSDDSSCAFADDSSPAIKVGAAIHFDSVDSALEEAVLRHVTQLAAAPVILDRAGGVVHSERELRIVAPNSGDRAADEAAAVAIEFGVLRGLLDLNAPAAHRNRGGSGAGKTQRKFGAADLADWDSGISRVMAWVKKWWPFCVFALVGTMGVLRASGAGVAARGIQGGKNIRNSEKIRKLKHAPLGMPFWGAGLFRVLPDIEDAEAAQGQFATGEGFKITDGTDFLVVDPCAGHTKLFASISQTGNTQVVAGTASKKIYVCSIHVVAAAAADVAVVEGTGTACATGVAGVPGFGGATAATGWNFAANGGIALGNGDSSLGAEGTSGDNLCVFNSGSGQISGGISYVVQ